jgi:hypothetical protein
VLALEGLWREEGSPPPRGTPVVKDPCCDELRVVPAFPVYVSPLKTSSLSPRIAVRPARRAVHPHGLASRPGRRKARLPRREPHPVRRRARPTRRIVRPVRSRGAALEASRSTPGARGCPRKARGSPREAEQPPPKASLLPPGANDPPRGKDGRRDPVIRRRWSQSKVFGTDGVVGGCGSLTTEASDELRPGGRRGGALFYSVYIAITRSTAREQTAQKSWVLRVNITQSTSGR